MFACGPCGAYISECSTLCSSHGTQVSEDDKQELGEIARSIGALFGGEEGDEEEVETAAAVASGGTDEDHIEVSVALGLEDELDINKESAATSAAGDTAEAGPDVPADTSEADPGVPAEVEDPEQASIQAGPTLTETGQALKEATSQFLEAPIHEREGVQRALRSAIEASRSAGAFDEIASSVNVLILKGATDSVVRDLADEVSDEDVLAQIVLQLGGVRGEEEREALIEAYVRLGDTIAQVIADALTDTEDRLARKTYVAALGAFGSAGAHAVEKMLKDSRWFVVRNGVAVLGVVGGPSSIEHLIGSLANEHAKVRRETVRSLAKIGGENAGLLVPSMLGDSDAEVRAAAARAVAVLKADRAYKQLIEMLRKGDEEAVIEQVLRALGALGDPSAVSAIAKGAQGSFFSRPSKGVRLAALAALAAIGTPHAVSLVKKARSDKDAEISSTAARLLSGK